MVMGFLLGRAAARFCQFPPFMRWRWFPDGDQSRRF